MNRSLTNVLFGGLGSTAPVQETKMEGAITTTNVDDVVDSLTNSESVILVVGYGMAVAKAQYAISEIVSLLRAKGINVRVCVFTLTRVHSIDFVCIVRYPPSSRTHARAMQRVAC